jgi:hypothetical protein
MLSKIERAARPTKRDTAEQLDRLFGTDGALLRSWSDATRRTVEPNWFRQVNELESRAVAITAYHSHLIPGVLQTTDYARVILASGRALDTEEQIEAWLRLRAKRVERILKRGDPALTTIIPEHVLRMCVGGPEVMAAQLAHIADLAESNAVQLCVLPESVGTVVGASVGPFRLIEFPDRLPVLYVESATEDGVIDLPREVQRFIRVTATLTAWSASPGGSLALLRKIRESA